MTVIVNSCKDKDDKKENEPNATTSDTTVTTDTLVEPPLIEEKTAVEYYSPTVVAPGSQLQLHGKALSKATVTIGNIIAEIDSVSKDGYVLYIKVPNELSIGSQYSVVVNYDETESVEFTTKLKISASTSLVKELLISDFDGGGIRSAMVTTDFTNGFFEANAGVNSSVGINTDINAIASSPAGGNYVYATVEGGGILPNTFGYVADISSKTGFQNDLVSPWPENFLNYPGSVITSENQDLKEYYINFLVNFNNTKESQLRIFIGNSDVKLAKQFARTIKPRGIYTVTGWQKVSIALSVFKDEFGFGTAMKFQDFLQSNKIMFQFMDSYENYYTDCCKPSGDINNDYIYDCCDTAIKDPVQIYIDQVVISQGGEALSIQ